MQWGSEVTLVQREKRHRDWSGDALKGLRRKISISVRMSNHTEPVRRCKQNKNC